jgi:hypothetical protein
MKRIFKVLTVAQLAFQAYNYYMECKRGKKVDQLNAKLERMQSH